MSLLSSSFKKLTLSSLAAGISIGIACIAFLKTGNAWVFPIGLFMVCYFGFHLYTGRICYAEKLIDAPDLVWMLFMNIVGAALLGVITHFVYPELAQKATELAVAKINEDWQVFPRAILCNIMIFVAVECWKDYSPDNINKIKFQDKTIIHLHNPVKFFGLIFATAIFVICGFEHCVANAFYFGCAFNHDVNVLWYIPANILGNTIGGIAAYRATKYVRGW